MRLNSGVHPSSPHTYHTPPTEQHSAAIVCDECSYAAPFSAQLNLCCGWRCLIFPQDDRKLRQTIDCNCSRLQATRLLRCNRRSRPANWAARRREVAVGVAGDILHFYSSAIRRRYIYDVVARTSTIMLLFSIRQCVCSIIVAARSNI